MAQSNKPKPDTKPVGLGELLRRAEVGTYLYLTVKDSTISAYAAGAGVKVKTERLLAIHPATKEVVDLTRVHIESRKDEAAKPAAPAAPRTRAVSAPDTPIPGHRVDTSTRVRRQRHAEPVAQPDVPATPRRVIPNLRARRT